MRPSFRLILATLFAICAVPAFAAVTPEQAGKFVQSVGDEVVRLVADKSAPIDQREAKLRDVFQRSVDVEWVAKFVLGTSWRSAEDAQKQRYLDAYAPFITKTYAARFSEYTGEQFQVKDSRAESDDSVTVNAEVVRPGQENIAVQFRVRQDKASKAPRIFDVTVEGVSQLQTQRSEFASVISRNGLDYLIGKLEARAQQSAAK